MDEILGNYCRFSRFLDRIEILNLPNRILWDFIKYIPEEKIAEYGEKNALLDSVDFFDSMGYSRDYDTFKFLVTEHFGNIKFTKWFSCFYHDMETEDLFHFQHSLGYKWSVFIDSYLKTILREIKINKVNSRIYDYAVTLKIPKSQLKTN